MSKGLPIHLFRNIGIRLIGLSFLIVGSYHSILAQDVVWEMKFSQNNGSLNNWKKINEFDESFWSDGSEHWSVHSNHLTMISRNGSDDVYLKSSIKTTHSSKLEVSYEVRQNPANADVRFEDTDDSCIKIYLAFGKGLNAKTLCFVHNPSSFEKPYAQARGWFKSKLKYIRMNNKTDQKKVEFTCNIYALYESIFGKTSNLEIKKIAIRSDAKDTGSNAEVILSRFRIIN